jgi:NAD+ synthase (glutamine-hydrolysing)
MTEIDIRPAATQMLADLGHPAGRGEPVYDVTFENVQAGLRADYLFRLANQHSGIVLGTGDLSELALGWATYGVGDHMSHYAVNAGLPKTVIQEFVRHIAASGRYGDDAAAVLFEILDQEISPELIPAGADGALQSTQDTIGPYALHDFTLYWTLRGHRPARIAYLAEQAFAGRYDRATIAHWSEVFFRRFFAHQFKRSASPDGPGVLGASLSPRGAWRMPSDASAAAWLADVATIPR